TSCRRTSGLRASRVGPESRSPGGGTMELFTTESIWTMIHGIVLGGGAMLALAAALYELWVTAPAESLSPRRVRYFTGLNAATTVLLWLSVLVGSFVVFPIYRVPPPEGVTDLSEYP